ncbi:hypothetical protein [Stutzerimonas kunmingensis]|uniref:hypothetical protein n=1 Tax=Stutzerimonas kunmingensis TaxID=1211807 RepID=UPI000CE3CEAD|nr:hypothetical protein [Stutzerimonas kunmingensis]
MISFFRKRLGGQNFNNGYITIVYPARGQGIVVNDSLSAESLEVPLPGAFAENILILDFEKEDDDLSGEDAFNREPLFCINPGTGLLMVDDFIDCGGNLFGCSDD